LKRKQNFASDLFTMLSAANVSITVTNAITGNTQTLSCSEFIGINLHGLVIRYMTIPLGACTLASSFLICASLTSAFHRFQSLLHGQDGVASPLRPLLRQHWRVVHFGHGWANSHRRFHHHGRTPW
jgi:hypothetical protein